MVNIIRNWNSTDSEIHYRNNVAQIDPYYSDTNVKYTFNEMGYRTHSFDSIEKDFVLCFGCSYTEGVGVGDADTWPAKLQSHSGTQTINLGMGGGSTQSIMINSTQWIRSGMPKPSCVVIQIPEVTREPCVSLKSQVAHGLTPWGGDNGLSNNKSLSTIFLECTRPNYEPGSIGQPDANYHDRWRQYRDKFPSELKNPKEYNKEPEVTPWFMTSMQMHTLQTMWNAVGVPVLQMTYDDDGDTVYNPNNVFRITGEFTKNSDGSVDYGRDLCHNGRKTNQNIAEGIWPEIQELLEQPLSGEYPTRQRRDIRRLPYDREQCTMPQALAKAENFNRKKGGPFIYE